MAGWGARWDSTEGEPKHFGGGSVFLLGPAVIETGKTRLKRQSLAFDQGKMRSRTDTGMEVRSETSDMGVAFLGRKNSESTMEVVSRMEMGNVLGRA